MITYSIEIIGLDRALSSAGRLVERLSSFRRLWDRFAKEFYAQEKSLFDRAPWKPLSPAYAERKRRKFGDKPILQATSTLFRSLTQQGAEGNVHRVDDNSLEIGSAVPYGIFHVPTRDPLPDPDEDRYVTIAGQYVSEIVREAGFN